MAERIYTLLFFAQGIGVYADDTEGNPWTPFELGNGVVCGECGKTITHGYVRGGMTEEQLRVCCTHIRWEGLPPLPSNEHEG
jgi:hypothetical protein